uniref:small monomeric GTPase n=1 Tax=Angiostrongylus cantonensis TaxID=6313 RepID=A0A0K0CVK8_ANGCA
MLHTSPTPIDRLSHSDYCSLSSSDDDIEACSRISMTTAGICPHSCYTSMRPLVVCKVLRYITGILSYDINYSKIVQRPPKMMDVDDAAVKVTFVYTSFHETTKSSIRFDGVTYKSPQCIVCGERPKTTPPVPNLELALFLRSLNVEKMTEHDNPAYRENIYDDSFCYDDDNCKRIRECRIGVMGASGVGKTSLIRVQYGNDVLFSDLLGNSAEACLSNTFMIDIIDPSIPIVLVGSKSDLYRKRRVSAYEGQILARHIGCPFLEISAKTNDCVNEAFLELMRLFEKRRLTLS